MLLDQAYANTTCIYADEGNFADLTCYGFKNWSEVNAAYSSIKSMNSPRNIYLKPSEPFLLTSELNIFQFNKKIFLYGIIIIIIY
jgi:hypothetical protein